MKKFYTPILVTFFTLFLLYGTIASFKEIFLIFTGDRTEGIVSNIDYDLGLDTLIKTISYNVDGTSYTEFERGVFSPAYSKGDLVTIYYDPNNPNESVVVSFFTFVIPLLTVSSIILIVILFIRYAKHRKK